MPHRRGGRTGRGIGVSVPAVSVEHLSKSYGDTVAVRDVSFEVNKGEVFALLGPNGAGKTTTVEILEGFRERSGGRVETLGVDPADHSTQRWLRTRIGVVLQELAIEPYYSVRQVLDAQRRLLPQPAARRRGHRADRAGREGATNGSSGSRAASSAGSTSGSASSATPSSCSSTSRPPASTRPGVARPGTSSRRLAAGGHHGAADHALHGRGGGAGRPGGRPVQPGDRGQRHAVVHRRARPRRGDHPLPAARGRGPGELPVAAAEPAGDGHVSRSTPRTSCEVLHDLTGWALAGGHPLQGCRCSGSRSRTSTSG